MPGGTPTQPYRAPGTVTQVPTAPAWDPRKTTAPLIQSGPVVTPGVQNASAFGPTGVDSMQPAPGWNPSTAEASSPGFFKKIFQEMGKKFQDEAFVDAFTQAMHAGSLAATGGQAEGIVGALQGMSGVASQAAASRNTDKALKDRQLWEANLKDAADPNTPTKTTINIDGKGVTSKTVYPNSAVSALAGGQGATASQGVTNLGGSPSPFVTAEPSRPQPASNSIYSYAGVSPESLVAAYQLRQRQREAELSAQVDREKIAARDDRTANEKNLAAFKDFVRSNPDASEIEYLTTGHALGVIPIQEYQLAKAQLINENNPTLARELRMSLGAWFDPKKEADEATLRGQNIDLNKQRIAEGERAEVVLADGTPAKMTPAEHAEYQKAVALNTNATAYWRDYEKDPKVDWGAGWTEAKSFSEYVQWRSMMDAERRSATAPIDELKKRNAQFLADMKIGKPEMKNWIDTQIQMRGLQGLLGGPGWYDTFRVQFSNFAAKDLYDAAMIAGFSPEIVPANIPDDPDAFNVVDSNTGKVLATWRTPPPDAFTPIQPQVVPGGPLN